MTETSKQVAVTFLRATAPYEAGDVVGLQHDHAHRLVQARIVDFFPPRPDAATSSAGPLPPDVLDAMDRPQLVAFARTHLGLRDEPSVDVADNALRHAIRANVDPTLLVPDPASSEHGSGGGGAQQQEQIEAGKPAKGGKPKP